MRLQLLRAMADHRVVKATQVAGLLGRPMSCPTASGYLRLLFREGLVEPFANGYRITTAGLRAEPVPAQRVGNGPPLQKQTVTVLSVLAKSGPMTTGEVRVALPRVTSLDSRLRTIRDAGQTEFIGGKHHITDRGRDALARGLAHEAKKKRGSKAPVPKDKPASPVAPSPATPEQATAEPPSRPEQSQSEDVSMVLPSLRHGRSVRLTEIADVAGVSQEAVRAEITRLRRLGYVRRAAPDTWQITHGGVSALRSELPERAPSAEEGDAVAAAIEAHVKAHGVTRLPSAGTDELVTANRERRVYQTDVWSPKSIQSRRKAAVRAGASSRRDEP